MDAPIKKKIVIVEDSDHLSNLLVRLFTDTFDTIALPEGDEVENICLRTRPDVILLDIMLQGEIDGLGVIRQLKGNAELSHIPIIFISAISSDEIVLEALRLGANDYLIKPFDLRQLKIKVNNLLSMFGQIRHKTLLDQHIPQNLPLLNNSDIVAGFNKIIDEKMVAGKSYNIQDIATALNVSLSTLNRAIKAKLGTTPNSHIMNRKLEKAKILIDSGKYTSLKEIAIVLGFNSLSYFSKSYKRKYGVFPSANAKP